MTMHHCGGDPLYRAESLRVPRVSARIWAQEFCGILRGQRAICEGGGHSGFVGAKVRKKAIDLYKIEFSLLVSLFCFFLHFLMNL